MQTQWKKVLTKTIVWIIAEVCLNSLGLDNLADYSEFIFEREVITTSHYFPTPALIIMPSDLCSYQ